MLHRIPQERLEALTAEPERGLSETEAAERLLRFGSNRIAEQPPSSVRKLAADTARDPMIWFLVLTSGLFGAIGRTADMWVLLAAVLPLIGMDFFLHRRTEASLAGLSSVLASSAVVRRQGSEARIAAEQLVPGDIALVSAGEPFPADGLIVGGDDLQAEESSLTGEAYPVAKQQLSLPGLPLTENAFDSRHWAFAGTRLLTGKATLVVALTGKETLYGEIVKSAITGPAGKTRLQEAVARLVRVLLAVALIFCLVLAGVRLAQGYGMVDALLSAATLAVAAIPEEFPVVLTFFLGVGVYRLTRRRVLVRRAVAVENIGRVSAICCDKTGTITEGRLALSDRIPAAGVNEAELLLTAAQASRRDSGDPLDAIVLKAAGDQAAAGALLRSFPFTEARRRETAVVAINGGRLRIATKGAAETILDLCVMPAEERRAWEEQVRSLARHAKKVIGCAWLDGPERSPPPSDEPAAGFRFAGVLAFVDPLRGGVSEAVAEATRAGIKVIMVTGDHADTAAAIARDAGMGAEPTVITGDQLEAMITSGADEELGRLRVIARATPAQKLLLVQALQRRGEIVAVTGDGVNDAPALRAADIGIAMGLRGTRAAREVSPMILLDDNFSSIVAAIAEGRQLFRNLRSSFAFLLIVHVPIVSSAALVPLLGYPLLYLPIHIVWLELIIHPAALLAFQQHRQERLTRATEDADFFRPAEWLRIFMTGGAIAAAVLFLFIGIVETGEEPAHARTLAMVTLVTAQAGAVAALTRLRGTAALMVTLLAIVSAFILPQWSVLAEPLALHTLPLRQWLGAAALGLGVSLIPILLLPQRPR